MNLKNLTFGRRRRGFQTSVEKFGRWTSDEAGNYESHSRKKQKNAAVIDADRGRSSNRRPVVRRVAPPAVLARWRRQPRARRRSRAALSSPRPRTPEKSSRKDHEKGDNVGCDRGISVGVCAADEEKSYSIGDGRLLYSTCVKLEGGEQQLAPTVNGTDNFHRPEAA